MSVAKDFAEGRLSAADLAAEAAAACRSRFALVVGPGDPIWELQVEVARQVLAVGGLSADEVVEWLAVVRAREVPCGEPGCSVCDGVSQ